MLEEKDNKENIGNINYVTFLWGVLPIPPETDLRIYHLGMMCNDVTMKIIYKSKGSNEINKENISDAPYIRFSTRNISV